MPQIVPQIIRIDSIRRQRTLARQVDVEGFGFWTSQNVVFSFRPAEANSGIQFFRDDLSDSEPIPALVEYRIPKPRQTSLANGIAQVDMIEHVLAALHGAQIDNCDIVVSAAEAPGMDGSSKPFIDAILNAGSVEQSAEKIRLKIVTPGKFIPCQNINNGMIEFLVNDEGRSIYQYTLQYDKPSPIPNQTARFDLQCSPQDFQKEIAPCRTFLTMEEAKYLKSQGICNRVSVKDVLVFDQNGSIDNQTLFDNECARHKILDMIGDFSLSPFDWECEIRAKKTGHQQNADALKMLLANVDPKLLF